MCRIGVSAVHIRNHDCAIQSFVVAAPVVAPAVAGVTLSYLPQATVAKVRFIRES